VRLFLQDRLSRASKHGVDHFTRWYLRNLNCLVLPRQSQNSNRNEWGASVAFSCLVSPHHVVDQELAASRRVICVWRSLLQASKALRRNTNCIVSQAADEYTVVRDKTFQYDAITVVELLPSWPSDSDDLKLQYDGSAC
jgi:hypothetical protein